MCLEYVKEMFNPNVTWHSHFKGKEKIVQLEKFFFSSSGNSIILKYQETYVQIQTFTGEN